jgi:hypothetical protein
MEYNDWHIYMQCGVGQNGIIIDQGVFISGSQLYIQGNMQSNTSGTTAPLTVTGDTNGNGTGSFSAIGETMIYMALEHNSTTNNPMTINFGATGNKMNNCFGKLRFSFTNSAWTPSNAVSSQFSFGGVITGDANLISLATANPPSGWA